MVVKHYLNKTLYNNYLAHCDITFSKCFLIICLCHFYSHLKITKRYLYIHIHVITNAIFDDMKRYMKTFVIILIRYTYILNVVTRIAFPKSTLYRIPLKSYNRSSNYLCFQCLKWLLHFIYNFQRVFVYKKMEF